MGLLLTFVRMLSRRAAPGEEYLGLLLEGCALPGSSTSADAPSRAGAGVPSSSCRCGRYAQEGSEPAGHETVTGEAPEAATAAPACVEQGQEQAGWTAAGMLPSLRNCRLGRARRGSGPAGHRTFQRPLSSSMAGASRGHSVGRVSLAARFNGCFS